jgi:hypothetical protein
MPMWIIGLIAAGAGLIGVGWQAGGHQAALRRRLNQELEILWRLPEGTREHSDMETCTMMTARKYIRWSRRPLWRRVLFVVERAALIAGAVYVAIRELRHGPLLSQAYRQLITETAMSIASWGIIGVVAIHLGLIVIATTIWASDTSRRGYLFAADLHSSAAVE